MHLPMKIWTGPFISGSGAGIRAVGSSGLCMRRKRRSAAIIAVACCIHCDKLEISLLGFVIQSFQWMQCLSSQFCSFWILKKFHSAGQLVVCAMCKPAEWTAGELDIANTVGAGGLDFPGAQESMACWNDRSTLYCFGYGSLAFPKYKRHQVGLTV